MLSKIKLLLIAALFNPFFFGSWQLAIIFKRAYQVDICIDRSWWVSQTFWKLIHKMIGLGLASTRNCRQLGARNDNREVKKCHVCLLSRISALCKDDGHVNYGGWRSKMNAHNIVFFEDSPLHLAHIFEEWVKYCLLINWFLNLSIKSS